MMKMPSGPTVFWEGYHFLDGRRGNVKVRAIYRPGDKTVAFEHEDGKDAMNQIRWAKLDAAPPGFLVDAARTMIEKKEGIEL